MSYLNRQDPRVISLFFLIFCNEMLYSPRNIRTDRCQHYHAHQRDHDPSAGSRFISLNLVIFLWHRKPRSKLAFVIEYE